MTKDNFHRVCLLKVEQGTNIFYAGTMRANDFLKIQTVDPVEYDIAKNIALKNTFSDDDEFFSYRIDADRRAKETFEDQGFQRSLDQTRANKIAKYLTENNGLFPNAVVVTCELLNDYLDADIIDEEVVDVEDILSEFKTPHNLSLLTKNDHHHYLYVPKNDKSLIIIDGQHRIGGLESSPSKFQKKFDILLSFIVGVDRSIVASHFYTVNYTQKGVNKSLLYHLTAEFNHELDELTFLHEVVKILNESDKSPFHTRIKMLGRSDPNRPQDEKKLMTISQSFLIDYLMYTIKNPCANGKIKKRPKLPPIFIYYYNNENGIYIVRFIVRFFSAVRDIFGDEWDNPKDSVLSKTPGIGGLLKFMGYFFIALSSQFNFELNPENIDDVKIKKMKQLLAGIEGVSFEAYSKTSSAGLLNEICNELKERCTWLQEEIDIDSRHKELVEEFYSWAVDC